MNIIYVCMHVSKHTFVNAMTAKAGTEIEQDINLIHLIVSYTHRKNKNFESLMKKAQGQHVEATHSFPNKLINLP